MLFIGYPPCSTCRNAQAYLQAHAVEYRFRNIKDEPPTRAELAAWFSQSGLPLKRFFNTSGLLYKSLHLKDRLTSMDESEMLDLLSSDGMLVKRPLLIGDDFVLVGFHESTWAARLNISVQP